MAKLSRGFGASFVISAPGSVGPLICRTRSGIPRWPSRVAVDPANDIQDIKGGYEMWEADCLGPSRGSGNVGLERVPMVCGPECYHGSAWSSGNPGDSREPSHHRSVPFGDPTRPVPAPGEQSQCLSIRTIGTASPLSTDTSRKPPAQWEWPGIVAGALSGLPRLHTHTSCGPEPDQHESPSKQIDDVAQRLPEWNFRYRPAKHCDHLGGLASLVL